MATEVRADGFQNRWYWQPNGSFSALRRQLRRAIVVTSGGTYVGGRPNRRGIAVDAWGWRLDPVRTCAGRRR